MTTHSSVLAWRVPGTGEPAGLPSMGSHRVGHDWSGFAVESPLDCKIKSVNPKGNWSWIFIGRTDAKDGTPILPPCENPNKGPGLCRLLRPSNLLPPKLGTSLCLLPKLGISHVAQHGVLCILFLRNCECQLLPSWRSFLCLLYYPYMMKQISGAFSLIEESHTH